MMVWVISVSHMVLGFSCFGQWVDEEEGEAQEESVDHAIDHKQWKARA